MGIIHCEVGMDVGMSHHEKKNKKVPTFITPSLNLYCAKHWLVFYKCVFSKNILTSKCLHERCCGIENEDR